MTPVVITIPTPPSVNAIWRSVRGRVIRSDRYRAWRTQAGYSLIEQKPKRIAGPVEIVIMVPESVRGDLDNRAKATLDLLVAHSVIADDNAKIVQAITIRRGNVPDCRITITPIATAVAA